MKEKEEGWGSAMGDLKKKSDIFCVKMSVQLHLFLVLLFFFDPALFYVDILGVSVIEGNSVTLNTYVETKQLEDIKWYFNDIRIAEISGDLSDICTDVQCEDGDERFRDRLMLDHQTGSLTITDTSFADSGLYELKLISRSSISEKFFNVTVHGVTAAEQDTKSVKEGESVTFDPGVVRNQRDVMKWYFNEILIAEITGYQGKICEDVQCNARFRDRVEVNYQTGSLTITNTRNTDSGLYKLKIISSRRINSVVSVKRFGVTVHVPGSGLSSGAVAGIVVGVLLLVAAAITAAVIYFHRRQAGQNDDGSTIIRMHYFRQTPALV